MSTDKPFKPPSKTKDASGLGGYYGCIGPKHPNMVRMMFFFFSRFVTFHCRYSM
jgi:hypothetical protein